MAQTWPVTLLGVTTQTWPVTLWDGESGYTWYDVEVEAIEGFRRPFLAPLDTSHVFAPLDVAAVLAPLDVAAVLAPLDVSAVLAPLDMEVEVDE